MPYFGRRSAHRLAKVNQQHSLKKKQETWSYSKSGNHGCQSLTWLISTGTSLTSLAILHDRYRQRCPHNGAVILRPRSTAVRFAQFVFTSGDHRSSSQLWKLAGTTSL